ncbi:MAG TPA: heme-binding protein, partial [Methylomirabilota bacterium]|nr:heme-binding protein [Methylomirabilota bacterium]
PRRRRAVLPRAGGRRRRLGGALVSALALEQARACIARGVAQAQRLGFQVAIAVVDAAGHLVACERMDGALWVTPEIARAKANAAAAFRATTLELEERFAKRMLFADNVATLGAYPFVFGRGGVPVVADGRIVGAVGVSGAVPAEHDHAIADVAARPH